MMSDDSENDGIYPEHDENDLYYKKYKLLAERCEDLQKKNERLVYRIQAVKKISKRRFEQVMFMKDRLLNEYNEDWKVIPKYATFNLDDIDEEDDVKPVISKLQANKFKEKHVEEKSKRVKKEVKRRRTTRAEKDPNAPKRPSNPFFQFCQEQRQILMEQIISELKPGEPEPSKQELTRQLAIKWKSLGVHDKQIYVDMYERSKEKYAAEMTEYNMKK